MSMNMFKDTFKRMYRNSTYRVWLWVLGFFTVLVTFIRYKQQKGRDRFAEMKEELKQELESTSIRETLLQEALVQVRKKNEYFNKNVSETEVEKQAKMIADKNFEQILHDRAKEKTESCGVHEVTMASVV